MCDIPPAFEEEQITKCDCESIVFGQRPKDLKWCFPSSSSHLLLATSRSSELISQGFLSWQPPCTANVTHIALHVKSEFRLTLST